MVPDLAKEDMEPWFDSATWFNSPTPPRGSVRHFLSLFALFSDSEVSIARSRPLSMDTTWTLLPPFGIPRNTVGRGLYRTIRVMEPAHLDPPLLLDLGMAFGVLLADVFLDNVS